jgi:kynureninase
MLNRHRNHFPTLASGIHLLSHSLGPVPRAARESMLAYCDAWENHTSEDAWATSWWELSQRVGDRIAQILGGAPGSVQIQPNASIALATVASCFDFKSSRRNKVVTTSLDFPSMEYIWDGQRQVGARVEVVSSPDGISVPLEKILAAIDDETADRWAIIAAFLKKNGTPVASNDIWIAASAMQYGLPILTSDRDFQKIPQVMVRHFSPA